jgi:hypothetical protein
VPHVVSGGCSRGVSSVCFGEITAGEHRDEERLRREITSRLFHCSYDGLFHCSDIGDAKSGGDHLFVRTMEGQERHGRHAPLVAPSNNEMYVELASYLYDSAPTKNIIKFEMNAVNYEHPLTQTFFCEVARCVPAVATGTVPSANAETLLRSGHASPQEPNESCCCW